MKKILTISIALLSLLLIFSLSSCGKKDSASTTGSGSTFSLKGSGT